MRRNENFVFPLNYRSRLHLNWEKYCDYLYNLSGEKKLLSATHSVRIKNNNMWKKQNQEIKNKIDFKKRKKNERKGVKERAQK